MSERPVSPNTATPRQVNPEVLSGQMYSRRYPLFGMIQCYTSVEHTNNYGSNLVIYRIDIKNRKK
jgi:hypothetical protein